MPNILKISWGNGWPSKNAEVLIKKSIKNLKKLNMAEKIEIIENQKKIPDKKKK